MTRATGLMMAGAVISLAAALSMGQAPEAIPAPGAAARPALKPQLLRVIHDVDYRRPEPERLVVALQFIAGAEMNIAWVQPAVTAERALDERGNSYAGASAIPADLMAGRPIGGMAPQGDQRQFQVLLKMPPRDVELGRTLQVVEGTLPAALIARTHGVALDIPGTTTHAFEDGAVATLTSSMQAPSVGRVNIVVDLPAAMAEGDRRKWGRQLAGTRLRVIGPGATWKAAGNLGSSTTTRVTRDLYFDLSSGGNPPAPTRAEVDLVVDTTPTTLSFRMENVPLP